MGRKNEGTWGGGMSLEPILGFKFRERKEGIDI